MNQWSSRSQPQDVLSSSASASAFAYPTPSWDDHSLVTVRSTTLPKKDFTDSYGAEDNDDEFFESQEQAVRRLSGACRQCKKLKTKCEFVPEYNMCRRCKIKERLCVFEGRKKTEHKQEVLIAQLRDKEATIDALLNKIKSRLIVQEDQNSLKHTNSDACSNTPPNQETQRWIRKLYERYPPDPNNDWTAPSTEIHQWDGEDKDDSERTKSGVGNAEDDGDDDDEDSEFEEGILLQMHPILVHHIPSIPVPLGYIADFSRRMRTKPVYRPTRYEPVHDDDDHEYGIAHPKYFFPGPASDIDQRRFHVERERVPDMLMHGLLTMSDVDELFKIYFERLNAFVSLLDPVLHTPANTFSRSPFLFTVICAIASRYYTPKRAIYKYAMHFAKVLAGSYLVNGWKTVELCQAYILLSTFCMPAKKWEEDRSRLYLELAVRIALDLNLHKPLSSHNFSTEKYKRESLNRTRTWLNCYNLDCSMSTLLGRTAMLTPAVVGDMEEWYTHSPYNHAYDVHLCAYTEALRLMCQFHETVRGVKGKKDLGFYQLVTVDFNDQLDDVHARIAERYDRESDQNDSGCVFRTGLLPLIINYFRLVMFSFGFQEAVDRGSLQKGDIFFQNCFDAACNVITSMIDLLAPMGYMRFSPDCYFVFVAFAAAFLLKLLRPDFTKIVKRSHKDQISTLVRKLIRFLGSAEVAVDEQHTPKLYSRFLAELTARMFPTNSSSSSYSRSKNLVNVSANGNVGNGGGNSNGNRKLRLVEDNPEAGVAVVEQFQSQEQGSTTGTEAHGMTETGLRSTGSGGNENSDYGPPPRVRYPHEVYPVQTQEHYTYYSQLPVDNDNAVLSQGQEYDVDTPSQVHPQAQPYSLYQNSTAGTGAEFVNNNNNNNHTGAETDTWFQHPQTANISISGVDAYMTDEAMSLIPALTTEEYTLSMQAINNPKWWENVMMPGWSWPPSSQAQVVSHNEAPFGMEDYKQYQEQEQVQYEYGYEYEYGSQSPQQMMPVHGTDIIQADNGLEPQQVLYSNSTQYSANAYHHGEADHIAHNTSQPQYEHQFVGGQVNSSF